MGWGKKMRFKVILHKDAVKDYKKADSKLRTRISKAIDTIAENPFYDVHIKKLEGQLSGMYRYRIGDMRILYEIHNDVKIVRIKAIESRGGVYN